MASCQSGNETANSKPKRDNKDASVAAVEKEQLDELDKLQLELARYVEEDGGEIIGSELPYETNIAKSVKSLFCGERDCDLDGQTTEFCDQSLSTRVQIDNYRYILTKRNPTLSTAEIESILYNHIEMRENRCAYLFHHHDNQFQIINSTNDPLVLFVESCPGLNRDTLMQFHCKTSVYPISNHPQALELSPNDKVILLTIDEPINAIGSFPRTESWSGQEFWVQPHAIPALRDLFITQEYLASYSHNYIYALDFRMALGEDITSTKGGVVVTNNTGSTIRCKKENSLFKIYKDGVRVGQTGKSCEDCSYSTVPEICTNRNGSNRVLVQHVDNTYSSYSHLETENPHINFGDVIEQGKPIGKIGLTGWTDGPHLHLEIQQAKITASEVVFRSIPVHFKPRYAGETVYPDKARVYLQASMTPEQIRNWKNEWHGKQVVIGDIPADSAKFDCETRFAELVRAPSKDCHFRITGSSYWPNGYSESNIRNYATLRAKTGLSCLQELLGNDISTEIAYSYADGPQSLPAQEQKSFRKITVDISCF